ncbi:NUDIX domain-containing protein [Streptomyces sp. V4-01]|uniref:NUDIX domain-containing protein n=1 Tax=Actinacidiphila polyblastidii TaxID=3110430 RepID=A0ABU7PF75_9ACTN|nr:NUDIX domain-containing protein [Streptomyces sp. V4-01]
MTMLVAAVIVHDRAAGRVVLLRRGERARFGRGLWDLPSGKREPGEPVTAAAVRELHEETGLSVREDDLVLAHLVHGAWGAQSPGGFVTVVFAAYAWTGELSNREPEKHAAVAWADTGALPGAFVPSAAGALRAHLAGDPPGVTLRGWD